MSAGSPSSLTAVRDRWLLAVLSKRLGEDVIESLEHDATESMWSSIVDRGLLAESDVVAEIASHFQVPIADFRRVTQQALELVPERWARQFGVLPLTIENDVLVVATSNPCDVDCERALAFAAGRSVRFALASPRVIAARLDAVYGGAEIESLDHIMANETERHVDVQLLAAEPESYDHHAVLADDGQVVSRLVDDLLGSGISERASDIHIEPEEEAVIVRHRVDGVIRVVRRLPRPLAPALASRIKIISGLDIADRLRPQDGRARVAVDGVAVDLRISSLPAAHGEKIVIRVLDGRTAVRTLESIGFAPEELGRILRLLQAREGLLLVTGPTGSGKTTTLYAALRHLKQRGVNIVTVEDPIEYRLPGIVQVQVRERAGLTFAAALRSIMRQDPDVLLVGEIRDRETAEIAIQASLTGHLVLSTLHTNDAASAVTRLIDIGVAPYKIATAVKGVVAQRLLRRICGRCGTRPSAGCGVCGGSGYHGRLAIVEVLIATPEFERQVTTGESAERIAEAARRSGMLSLWQSGMLRVRAGDTSEQELLRVAQRPAESGRVDDERDINYLLQPQSPSPRLGQPSVSQLEIGTIDVYVIRPLRDGWRVLILQRGLDTRCPTAWESVHGHIEPGEEPEDAAVREVREETGLEVARLYSVTVQPFYLHRSHTVQLAVVFAAFVDEPAAVTLGAEHQRSEWLGLTEALDRFHWPREREALREIAQLLRTGDAGPVEDVLRVK